MSRGREQTTPSRAGRSPKLPRSQVEYLSATPRQQRAWEVLARELGVDLSAIP